MLITALFISISLNLFFVVLFFAWFIKYKSKAQIMNERETIIMHQKLCRIVYHNYCRKYNMNEKKRVKLVKLKNSRKIYIKINIIFQLKLRKQHKHSTCNMQRVNKIKLKFVNNKMYNIKNKKKFMLNLNAKYQYQNS